ncbi:MAG: Dabb family protein [Pseudomonadota bacterium]
MFLKVDDGETDLFAPAMRDLSAIVEKLEGASNLRYGPNEDFENSTPGYTHGFIIGFDSPAALATYANDADHRAVGARLVAMCTGGKDGISVFDIVTYG